MRTLIDSVAAVREQPRDLAPRSGPRGFLLFAILFVVACALASGCTCALPHEHVAVLADDAERFIELWEIEHSTGLTASQLSRQRDLAERLLKRASLAKRGLAVEGAGSRSKARRRRMRRPACRISIAWKRP